MWKTSILNLCTTYFYDNNSFNIKYLKKLENVINMLGLVVRCCYTTGIGRCLLHYINPRS